MMNDVSSKERALLDACEAEVKRDEEALEKAFNVCEANPSTFNEIVVGQSAMQLRRAQQIRMLALVAALESKAESEEDARAFDFFEENARALESARAAGSDSKAESEAGAASTPTTKR